MEELIEQIDENGKVLAIVNRKEAHKKGLLHRVVHICIINSQNEILLQKRSKNKKLYPNVWDISAAGHITAGEKSISSAIREVKEELGIKLEQDDFEFLFSFLDDLSIGNSCVKEIADVYLVRKDIDIKRMTIQEDEVEQVKWVSIDEFCKNCLGEDFCPHKKGFERLKEYFCEK